MLDFLLHREFFCAVPRVSKAIALIRFHGIWLHRMQRSAVCVCVFKEPKGLVEMGNDRDFSRVAV